MGIPIVCFTNKLLYENCILQKLSAKNILESTSIKQIPKRKEIIRIIDFTDYYFIRIVIL